MRIHLLSGFLGSGKTTAIQHASTTLLKQGVKIGVITNDQGIKLVDGDFLKSLGIPTELVIYPNQYHGITVPSYMKDRFSRYLDWFGKYLK